MSDDNIEDTPYFRSPAWLHEANLASHQSMRGFAELAIKGVTLVNGGAAIALLAFLPGALQLKGVLAWPFAIALPIFGIGACCGAICAGFATLSQSAYTREIQNIMAHEIDAAKVDHKSGERWRKVAQSVAWIGNVAFIVGLILAAIGFFGVQVPTK
jgi:hypothetical protein